LNDPLINDPTGCAGQRFSERFRLPLPVFKEIVVLYKESEDPLFNYAPVDFVGQWSTLLEVKILFVFRILAGGLRLIDSCELTGDMMPLHYLMQDIYCLLQMVILQMRLAISNLCRL
jgi:hypothetical protein